MAPAVCVIGIVGGFAALALFGAVSTGLAEEGAMEQATGALLGGGFMTAVLILASLPVLIIGFILSGRKHVLYCESCGATIDSL